MRITINDIAEMAGVAKSTVSRYLNGGAVGEATKRKIRRVIENTNYEPNSFAQSLKAKKTNIIGIIAPTLDSYVTSRVLMSADEQLRKQNYTSMIINTSKDAGREVESLLNLSRQKVDGIILIATQITREHLAAIDSIPVPVLVVGQEHPDCVCMMNDDYEAGFAIGDYILEKGHREIAYLGVGEHDIAVGQRRKKGVMDALAKAEGINIHEFVTSFEFDDAAAAAKTILDTCSPTALICATDTIAFGALKTVLREGKRVPEDLSLAGFGGYTISTVLHPSLTTVGFRNDETGMLAAKTIIRMTAGEAVPQLQVRGFDLIEGESVAFLK